MKDGRWELDTRWEQLRRVLERSDGPTKPSCVRHRAVLERRPRAQKAPYAVHLDALPVRE